MLLMKKSGWKQLNIVFVSGRDISGAVSTLFIAVVITPLSLISSNTVLQLT